MIDFFCVPFGILLNYMLNHAPIIHASPPLHPSDCRWLWLFCSSACLESVCTGPPRWGTAWSWRTSYRGRPASMTSSAPSSSSSPSTTCTWLRSELITPKTSSSCTNFTRGFIPFATCWKRTTASCRACGCTSSGTGCKVAYNLMSCYISNRMSLFICVYLSVRFGIWVDTFQ